MVEKKKKNFSFLSILFIVLTVVLVWLFVIPIFDSDSKEVTKRVICRSHLKHILVAVLCYQIDQQVWPDQKKWGDVLMPYIGEPADADELPPDLVMLFESTPGWNQVGGPDDIVTDRHGEKNPGANIAFADGHVEFVKPEDILALRWTVEQKRGAEATR
jgi:prepilin-type processing-associated H-X9-DG protein